VSGRVHPQRTDRGLRGLIFRSRCALSVQSGHGTTVHGTGSFGELVGKHLDTPIGPIDQDQINLFAEPGRSPVDPCRSRAGQERTVRTTCHGYLTLAGPVLLAMCGGRGHLHGGQLRVQQVDSPRRSRGQPVADGVEVNGVEAVSGASRCHGFHAGDGGLGQASCVAQVVYRYTTDGGLRPD